MKAGFILFKCIDTIQIQNMKMDIEIKTSSETLDKSYRTCFGCKKPPLFFLYLMQIR